MSRVILVSGKGGTGKTTVASATALAAADRGKRTLVMSFDLAHSLSDSFDLGSALFDQHDGLPVRVSDNLDVQEINVPMEMERHWSDIYQYLAMLLTSTGLSSVVAKEVAIMPGMEDIISLMYINKYLQDGDYDALIVDCPPTAESLRFVNMTSTIEWYMLKRFNIDRMLVKVARPIAGRFTDYQLPQDSYFDALRSIHQRITGVDEILVNPQVTTARLVTNPEKMVVRETQRAYMYFCLYGITTDRVVMNRLMPRSEDPYFARWAAAQNGYADEVERFFQPIPVSRLPLFEQEVLGVDRLREVARQVYGDADPLATEIRKPPFSFTQQDGNSYLLALDVPLVSRREVDLVRSGDELIISVGSFRRHIPLPQSVMKHDVRSARIENDQLLVHFSREAP